MKNDLREKLAEIWGLEEAPDGEQDMMLTRDDDDAVIEGVSYAEELDQTLALIQRLELALLDEVMGKKIEHKSPFFDERIHASTTVVPVSAIQAIRDREAKK